MASLVVLKVLFTVPENIIRKECHDEARSLALVIYLKVILPILFLHVSFGGTGPLYQLGYITVDHLDLVLVCLFNYASLP